jgi:phenazine biosynthesis protein phzE
VTRELLERGTPFFSVCLGHQVLSTLLGLHVVRRNVPNQGVQQKIDFFGRTEQVGFYNTFTARDSRDLVACPIRQGAVEVFREESTCDVHALRGPGFASVQFHPESVLTRNGIGILAEILGNLIDDDANSAPGAPSDLETASASDRKASLISGLLWQCLLVPSVVHDAPEKELWRPDDR